MSIAYSLPPGERWQSAAYCAGLFEVFGSMEPQAIGLAQALCGVCPVKNPCAAQKGASVGVRAGRPDSEQRIAIREVRQKNQRKFQETEEARKQIIRELVPMFRKLGRMPGRREALDWPGAHITKRRIDRAFGNYTEAKKALALELLIRYKRSLARIPIADDIREGSGNGKVPGISTYRQYFGSLSSALRRIGESEVRETAHRSREVMIREYRELCISRGRILAPMDIERLAKEGQCASRYTYYRHFGSPVRLLEEAFPEGFAQ